VLKPGGRLVLEFDNALHGGALARSWPADLPGVCWLTHRMYYELRTPSG